MNYFQHVKLIWISLIRHIAMKLAWLVSLFRARTNYIKETWPGSTGDLTGRVCVFVHFDRRGEIHDFVLHYLDVLNEAGFKILFVSNSPKLAPNLDPLRKRTSLILHRGNIGYDFGAYKDGILAIPDLGRVDLLLLANDSVYGPFWPVASILERMDFAKANFWGITDSYEFAYHIQSYFLAFGAEAIRDPAFLKFWHGVGYVNSKHYIIRKYEVQLSQTLMRAGLRGAALCGAREAALAVVDVVRSGALENEEVDAHTKHHLRSLFHLTQRGLPINMSHSLWDYMIVKMQCPFIKRELLHRNPMGVPYVSRWPNVIASVSDYDTDLIARHLQRSLKRRFV